MPEQSSHSGWPSPRILIVRLGAMGDVIHAMPAVAALRAAIPKAHIGWVVENRWRPLLCACEGSCFGVPSMVRPLVDAVHVVDTRRWRKSILSGETRQEAKTVIADLRAAHYDIAIDFQGAIKSALVSQLSRAEVRLGFESPREKLATMFYTRTVCTRAAHVIDQNLELASDVAGRELAALPAQFPVDLAAREWCDRELATHDLGRFGILNPGAGWGAKLWPAERYAEVARALSVPLGMRFVVNYGPGEDAVARAVEEQSDGAAVMISCTVPELIELTRRAAIFVGGDTGPLHLAAALGVPTVALFGPTDPARNGPYGTRSVVLRSATSRTSYSHTATVDEGLLSVSAAEAIAAAEQLLGVR